MSTNVKVLKLITGEEILCNAELKGELVSHGPDPRWKITNAVAVMLQPYQDDKGRTGYGHAFVPWGTLVDGPIHIDVSAVVYAEPASAEWVEQHQKMFGTIVTPPQGLVLAR